MRLPFKTRRQLKDEIENLQEQIRILSDERKKEAAKHRMTMKAADELDNTVKRLKEELRAAQPAPDVVSLQQEIKQLKGVNAGLASTVTQLKQRNASLAEQVRRLKEASTSYAKKSQQ